MSPDPYSVLGVRKGASQEAIQQAYRRWSRNCIPT